MEGGEQSDSSLEAESEERSNLGELRQGSCVVPTGLCNLSVPARLWLREAVCSRGPAQRLSFNKRQHPLVSILFLCTFYLGDIDYLVG